MLLRNHTTATSQLINEGRRLPRGTSKRPFLKVQF